MLKLATNLGFIVSVMARITGVFKFSNLTPIYEIFKKSYQFPQVRRAEAVVYVLIEIRSKMEI